jgi:hypothetical protein
MVEGAFRESDFLTPSSRDEKIYNYFDVVFSGSGDNKHCRWKFEIELSV